MIAAVMPARFAYDKRHKPTVFQLGDEVYLRQRKGYHLLGKPPRK